MIIIIIEVKFNEEQKKKQLLCMNLKTKMTRNKCEINLKIMDECIFNGI